MDKYVILEHATHGTNGPGGWQRLSALFTMVFSVLVILASLAIILPMFISDGKVPFNLVSLVMFGLPIIVSVLNFSAAHTYRKSYAQLSRYRLTTGAMAAFTFIFLTGGAPIGLIGFPVYVLALIATFTNRSSKKS